MKEEPDLTHELWYAYWSMLLLRFPARPAPFALDL